jgi:uncharacterized protein (TIGR02246 family)
MTSDENAIRQLIEDWLEASKAGDDDAVLQLMTEDAVFLQPGKAPMRGRGEFAQAQRAMGAMKIDAHADIQEIEIAGHWAWCWNYLTVTVTPPGSSAVTRAGNVLSVLRKQDGKWRIHRDANLLTRVDG